MIALDNQSQEHGDVLNVWRARLEEVDECSKNLHFVNAWTQMLILTGMDMAVIGEIFII